MYILLLDDGNDTTAVIQSDEAPCRITYLLSLEKK
jgi:hypothetical protein